MPGKVIAPVTLRAPPTVALPYNGKPDDPEILAPTLRVVPSNVKFASSSRDPAVPAITILLSVKSDTVTLDKVVFPAIRSAKRVVPETLKSEPSIVLPTTCKPEEPEMVTPTFNCVPSNIKLLSSSNSPPVPTITTLLSVKSVTFAVENVPSAGVLLPIEVLSIRPELISTLVISKLSKSISPAAVKAPILETVKVFAAIKYKICRCPK